MNTAEHGLRIFLAEDNQADVYLVGLALEEHGLRFTLISSTDGEDAMRKLTTFEGINCPDIALLDQNLPRVDGEKIMEAIREHEHCREIPIVIMSSCENWREHEAARKYGATFFRKSADLTSFLKLGALVKTLCQKMRDSRDSQAFHSTPH